MEEKKRKGHDLLSLQSLLLSSLETGASFRIKAMKCESELRKGKVQG